MVVKTLESIRFPNAGWLSTNAVGPQNGRYLVEIRGHSGMSSWSAGLLTLPEAALLAPPQKYEWVAQELYLRAGVYSVQEGEDKRKQRILRFYVAHEEPEYILFTTDGFLVPEASSQGVVAILECEGYSRTGRNGSRWALIAAPIGATVAVEPYYSSGDPIYYRVTEDGIVELGATDAVLAPDEW